MTMNTQPVRRPSSDELLNTNLLGPPRRMAWPHMRLPRRVKDRLTGQTFFAIATAPLILVAVMVITLARRAWPILAIVSLEELVFGHLWQPLKGAFGFYPFILGTVWVTGIAMTLAVPPALLCAIYLAEYARPATRLVAKPVLDLLASIPSVVYGVWGVVAIVPWVQRVIAPLLSRWLGFLPLFQATNPTGFGLLSGGIVLAVMVAPFIIAVTYEVICAVPAGVREASLAIGATQWQTIRHVLLPHTIPGILASVVLGASRALGETMAVLMVVGNVAQVPKSIFDAAYPLPALIANNYGEMLSIPLYDAALLGAAFILLLIVMIFNLASRLALRQITAREVGKR